MADETEVAAGAEGATTDAAAAEWEAMLGQTDAAQGIVAPAAGGGQATRVLNQDEIDSLLGFDDSRDSDSERAGIQAILNSALVSYERLPDARGGVRPPGAHVIDQHAQLHVGQR